MVNRYGFSAWRRVAALLLAGVFISGGAAAHQKTTQAAESLSFTPPAGSNVVTVVTREYGFSMPDSIPAGLTTFMLKDEGKENHHLMVVRLDEGKTMADVMAVFTHPGGPPPMWMHPIGGPNTPGPGGESNVTLMLKPGRYVAFCVIPAPDGKPHVMHGMITPFIVTPGNGQTAALPKPDVTITMQDYKFVMSQPITAGRHVIEVINAGSQPHELTITRYDSGQGNRDLEAWAYDPHGKPAPGYGMGGITDIAPGEHAVMQIDFKPGKYGFICFTPDMKDGKPHFMHGMQKEFVVR
ncbi:MAG TPA: hypothetical protein VFL45_10285 [Gammaproteobacteria bacterium]|nr:hypothetical protein [Gammaproteobacteria bacterium]